MGERVIKILDNLKRSGQLNDYLIDDDDDKWIKLVYDILINEFDMNFSNQTKITASKIYDEYVRPWRGQGKFKNVMNMESRRMKKNLTRLTEADIHRIVKQTIRKTINENWLTGKNMAPITEDDMINYEIGKVKKLLQLIDDWKEERLSPQETTKQMRETLKSIENGIEWCFGGAPPKTKAKWSNTMKRG